MADVFWWAIGGSSLIFVIGLISALESRKQNKETSKMERRMKSSNSEPAGIKKREADMAAGSGIVNIESGENLAAAGHSSR